MRTPHMYIPPKIVLDAFHGKVPRLYRRMCLAHPSAWGVAARAPREQVQTVLRTVGLEMRLVLSEERFAPRRPGAKSSPAFSFQIGKLVQTA